MNFITHTFQSPFTGRLFLKPNYIFEGDNNNYTFQSLKLKDLKLSFLNLRYDVDTLKQKNLKKDHIWIGDAFNEPQPQHQILVDNLPILVEATFPNPIPGVDFRIPNPTFDYLSAFDRVMSGPFLPQVFATNYDIWGNPTGTVASSTLAMTQVRLSQIMKRFDNAMFIVATDTLNFTWENIKMNLIPTQIKELYGLGETYTFTKAQSLGALETGILKNTVEDRVGRLSKAIAGADYVYTVEFQENMQLALIARENIVENVDVAKFIARVDRLPVNNMPKLTKDKFWVGGDGDIPVESDIISYAPIDATYILKNPHGGLPNAQSLSVVAGLIGGILKTDQSGNLALASSGKVPVVNDYVAPSDLLEEVNLLEGIIESEVTVIENEIVALESEIVALESEIVALGGIVDAITGIATLALLLELLASLSWTAGYTAYEIAQAKVVIDDDVGLFSTTYSHMTGKGYLARTAGSTNTIAVKLNESVVFDTHDQRFSFHSNFEDSWFSLNTYTRNNDIVKNLNLGFLTSERVLDVLQPSGAYMREKGFFFSTEYGVDDDINAPKKISLNVLKYRDTKVYHSQPTEIEKIVEYDRTTDEIVTVKSFAPKSLILRTVTAEQTTKENELAICSDCEL